MIQIEANGRVFRFRKYSKLSIVIDGYADAKLTRFSRNDEPHKKWVQLKPYFSTVQRATMWLYEQLAKDELTDGGELVELSDAVAKMMDIKSELAEEVAGCSLPA